MDFFICKNKKYILKLWNIINNMKYINHKLSKNLFNPILKITPMRGNSFYLT